MGLFFAIGMINIISTPYRDNQLKFQIPSKKDIIKLKEKDEFDIERINFKEQRRKAMDSLIDNGILTPENIKEVDKKYPDSLCHC